MKRFPFTKRAIEALPAHALDSPSREAEYTDVESSGLHLRVGKNGRKFFQHRYRHLGRKRCVTLGEFPHVSLQEARLKVGQNKVLLARDVDPADERAQKRSDLTLAEFARDFYVPHATMHKKTWQEDVWKLNSRILPAMGDLRLSSITVRDVTSLHAHVKEKTTATTANHYLTLVRRMLNLAVKWGLLEKNPAAGMQKFKEPPHRERHLTKEELPRFLKALDCKEDRLSIAAIRLLLFTGCRKGEILSLRWENVQENRLFLPVTKNGKSRSVLLNAKAREVLESLRSQRKEGATDTDFVFPSRYGAREGHLEDLRRAFDKVCEAAGIDGMRVHDLRHSFATIAVMSGASLYDVQKLLGHSDVSMTQRYAHLAEESLQRATESVGKTIDQATAEKELMASEL
jgi:integrase